jgi:hypothetical protein
MRSILALTLVASLTGALQAQLPNFIGFAGGFDTSYTDRANINALDVDILQVFSTRDYRHWMLNPADRREQAPRGLPLHDAGPDRQHA